MLLALLFVFLTALPASAGDGSWTRVAFPEKMVGPVAVDPSNPDLLLAGVVTVVRSNDGQQWTLEGLFRSTDRGKTWTLAGPGAKHRGVGFVEFDPKDSRIVYAVMGSCDQDCEGDPRGGLFRSADGGKTWTLVVPDPVHRIAIYQADPRIVYITTGELPSWHSAMIASALASGTTMAPLEPLNGALAKSTDRGLTWSARPLPKAQPFEQYLDLIALHPRNSNVILAWHPSGGEAGGGDLLRSADGGKTWRQLPRSLGVANLDNEGPYQVAFDATGSSVYASGSLGYDSKGTNPWAVLRSTDDGRTWRAVLRSPDKHYGAVLSNPLQAAEIFVAEDRSTSGEHHEFRVLRSANRGGSFSQVGSDLRVGGIGSLILDQANPQTLYAATDDGLWAYTFDSDANVLPRAGDPVGDLLPGALGAGVALALLGLRLCRRMPAG